LTTFLAPNKHLKGVKTSEIIMKQLQEKLKKNSNEIADIGITNDSLTGRGGLTFILRYLKKINIIPKVCEVFNGVRKSRKGRDIEKIINQLMFYFMDGSKQTMTRFDELSDNEGYRKSIETAKKDMCSSHTMKRFFNSVEKSMFKKLQSLMLELFIWRLKIEKPKVVILGIDTMVLDNNDAKKREGVSPTYKKVNGYHPLHIYWKSYVVNMAFHQGSEAPNHDNDLFDSIKATVSIIRKRYNRKVQIIVVSDCGFSDQKYFNFMDSLKAYFICGTKILDSVKLKLMLTLQREWNKFEYHIEERNYHNTIEYLDFRDKRGNWKKDYRAIYMKQADIDGELHLEFDRPETLIYTNLEIKDGRKKISFRKYLEPEQIIRLYRMRAKDELVNRGLKEFSDETLPFKRFDSNGVYYYLSLISYDLLTAFQTDVLSPIIPVCSYPDTVRRLFIDIAGKIVKSGGKIIIKFREEVIKQLNLFELWKKCASASPV